MTKPLWPHEVTCLLPPETDFDYELWRLIKIVEVENHNSGFYTALNQELKPDWGKLDGAQFAARSALLAFIHRHLQERAG